MNTKHTILLAITIGLFSACGNQKNDASQNEPSPSLTGEFWLNGEQLIFAECGSGLTLNVTGSAVEEMKKALSDNQVSGLDRLYAEIQGNINNTENGRTLSANSLMLADKTKSCLRGSSENAGGTYSASLPSASSPGREMILELAPDSSAILSTDYLNGQPVVVQNGKWKAAKGDKVILSFANKMGETYDIEFVSTWDHDLSFSGDLFGSEGLTMKKQGPSRLQLIREALYAEVGQFGGGKVTAEQLSPSTELSQVLSGEKDWNSLLAFISWNLNLEKDERNALRNRFKTLGEVENYFHDALVQGNIILKRIYVGPMPGKCAGLDSNQCLEVRPSEESWASIVVPIENFSFEPGAMYDITVSESRKPSAPGGQVAMHRSLFRQNKTLRVQADYKLHDKWAVIELNGNAVGALAFREHPYLEFNLTENKIFGHTGCNKLFGDLNADKDSLSFASIATTKMMCSEIAEFEGSLLESLRKVNSFRISDVSLELLSGGAVVMRLRKSE